MQLLKVSCLLFCGLRERFYQGHFASQNLMNKEKKANVCVIMAYNYKLKIFNNYSW